MILKGRIGSLKVCLSTSVRRIIRSKCRKNNGWDILRILDQLWAILLSANYSSKTLGGKLTNLLGIQKDDS